MALVALAVALPGGLLCAVCLSEYAPAAARRAAAPLVLLAGVPTVVYGCFALQFVTPLLQRLLPGLAGVNALSPGLVAGVMILPMVAALAADALRSVPGPRRPFCRPRTSCAPPPGARRPTRPSGRRSSPSGCCCSPAFSA